MALTPSSMLPLGTQAPGFTLFDTISGQTLQLQDLKSDIATVIMFICNHCPYVKHIEHELVRLAQDYQPKGVSFIAINSNDADAYPEDAPDKMKAVAQRLVFPFPYLYDETQEIAKAYQAACTPDFYIFDENLKCIYRGQLDSARPKNDIPVTAESIRSALDKHLADKSILENQIPSMGCNIKWK